MRSLRKLIMSPSAAGRISPCVSGYHAYQHDLALRVGVRSTSYQSCFVRRHSIVAIDVNVVARALHSSKCRALTGSVG